MPTVHQTHGPHNGPPMKVRVTANISTQADTPPRSAGISVTFPKPPLEGGSEKAPMKYLRMPEVIVRTGFKKTFLYDSIREKTFPPHIKVGRCSCFIESEVLAVQRAWSRGMNREEIRLLIASLVASR